jgi:Tol biopolymer transport system component
VFDVWEIRMRERVPAQAPGASGAGPAQGLVAAGRPRNLTDRVAVEHFPSWIPGTTGLVIASNQLGGNRDLWRIDAAAAGSLRRLTSTFDFDFKPAVAPGGGRVAFYRREFCGTCLNDRGPADVMLMDIAGGNERRLVGTPGRDETDPAWSPDGRAIAYTSGAFRSGTGPVEDAELMVATADGRRRRRLTDGWENVVEPSWGRVPSLLGSSPSPIASPSPS